MTDILMPALSPTMEEGTLAKWHVKAGDTVAAGDVIAEIETDKATMEVEAVDEGVVAGDPGGRRLRGREGQHAHRPPGRATTPRPAPTKADGAKDDAEGRARRRSREEGPGSGRASARRRGRRARDAEGRAEATRKSRPDAKLVKITVRDALRDAMAEEMRRDDKRLPDGRGSRPVPGRLQGQPRPAAGVRRPARHRHARSPSTASPAWASARPWRA